MSIADLAAKHLAKRYGSVAASPALSYDATVDALHELVEECAKVAESEPRVWEADAPDPQHRIAQRIRSLASDATK